MTTFHDEAALFLAWPTGVALAGERYFGDGTHSPPPPRARGPRTQSRVHHQGARCPVVRGAVFLAAPISFDDCDTGGGMLKNNDAGLSDIAARLHEQRRRVIADLVNTYPGW